MTIDLNEWRREIDIIDGEILSLLERRFEVVKQIGIYKKEHGLPVVNKQREEELLKCLAERSSLEPGFILELYRVIFNQSYNLEE
ncbi:chorismate mutase [Candidatus Falkowbacteria bacterium]|nr:chorismate mutase [Candidatus Falkowbacteria bacterium]